ncbi:MAG: cyclase family protein [Thermoplasmata archaeon]|nr:cyclase family protein [Thermoplasmata archaeon]
MAGDRARPIDVSMAVHPGMPSFPGDPAVVTAPVHRIDRGDPYNLSLWTFGSHTGTHVDPPLHFLPGGLATDALDLGVLNGPCQVVDVEPGTRAIGPAEVAKIPTRTTRVLFRTANSSRWAAGSAFFDDFVALSPSGAVALASTAVRLVGIDALSIESDPTGKFPVHHALLGRGVLILEGLQLAGAPAGSYELRCLPLRLAGGDGAPCRAVLLPT